jgi:hypothetical protein
MSQARHTSHRRYASLACNACRESKIKVQWLESSPEFSKHSDFISVMAALHIARAVSRRDAIACIELSTGGSECPFFEHAFRQLWTAVEKINGGV